MIAREQLEHVAAFERVLAAERSRLMRWCLRLVGDRDIAEDLVQETLSAAWRSKRWPAREQEYPAWLAGIARNICRSWLRSQRREAAHYIALLHPESEDERIVDTLDLEAMLERGELIELLERALGLLQPTTRALLLAKYIEEFPVAEIAARLKMSESAAASRLLRGKAALRHVLTTQLRQDMRDYGLVPREDDAAWNETRIWCPCCGQHHLQGQLIPETGTFRLRCPLCSGRIEMAHLIGQEIFQDIKSYRVALSRLSAWGHRYYRQGLATGTTACVSCGQAARVYPAASGALPPPLQGLRCIRVVCQHCGTTALAGASGLALCHPEVQRFWRAHPRIQTLPDRSLEYEGRPATLTRFLSKTDNAALDVISDRETCEILTIAGGPRA